MVPLDFSVILVFNMTEKYNSCRDKFSGDDVSPRYVLASMLFDLNIYSTSKF